MKSEALLCPCLAQASCFSAFWCPLCLTCSLFSDPALFSRSFCDSL